MKKTIKKTLSILMSVVLICSMVFSLQITPVIAEDTGTTDEVSFYENLSESEFAEDDTITVLIEFDYPENDYDIRETDSLESSQEHLRLLRASNRAYYTENNQEFIDDLDIEYDDMDVSAYSPYVFVTFDTWAEYTDARDDLIELSENSKVKKVFAEETPVTEEDAVTVNTSASTAELTLEEAKKMIGVKDENASNITNYTGEGIRVGFIESGSPDDLANFEDGQLKAVRNSVGTTEHATKVASILGGTYGIAPDAELYFAGSFSKDSIEWLISDEVNVNIINMSAAATSTYSGIYKGYDAYTDFICRNNNLLFIKSAGNRGQSLNQEYITNPGLGLNVITVGSVDASKNISCFSSYLTQDDFSKKPTMVAPGDYITVPNCNNSYNWNYGTSFSAPMVTGIAALLLEEFEDYVTYPELIAAALINGCEWLPGQTEIWDTYAGAGLVNYANARDIIYDSRYETATTIATLDSTRVVMQCSVQLASNENSITYCLFDMIKPNSYDIYSSVSGIKGNDIITPNITKYIVKIYNSSGTLVHTGTSENNIIVGKTGELQSGETYYIKVYMDGTKNSTESEYLALTYSTAHTHYHHYNCTYFKPATHKCYCTCGDYILEPHIYQPYVDDGSYCVVCSHIIN